MSMKTIQQELWMLHNPRKDTVVRVNLSAKSFL